MSLLNPDQYSQASVYDLLSAAAMGRAGVDRRWLHAILDRGREAVPDMLRFGLESREHDRIDLDSDLLAMFRHLRTPDALPFYPECARRFEFEFPEDLMESFVDLGERSIEPLLALRAEAEDPWNVMLTLAALRVREPRILDALIDQLKRDPVDGAMALAHYGDPAAIPALEQARRELPADSADAAGEIDNVIETLGEPRPAPETRVPYDIWAEGEDRYPEEDAPAFPALPDDELIGFLESPVPEYRAEALNMLAFDGLDPEYAPRVLEIAHKDPEVAVRAEALQALSESLGQPGIESALRTVLADASKPIAERAGALIGLAHCVAGDRDLQAVTLEFLGIPGVRSAALRTMWQSGDRRFASSIPAWLEDPDPGVRREAIAAVGWFGMTPQAARLPDLFNDEDLRASALLAYSLAAPGEISPSTAEKFLERIDDLAGGLPDDEASLVMHAINSRLQIHGFEPVFASEGKEEDCHDPDCGCGGPHEPAAPASVPQIGRNEPCPCGSGKKYKKCCGQ